MLVVCEGSRSRTREHFVDRFGAADTSVYAIDGRQVQDVVLGLRVKSDLPDPMAVLLTVAQNRFLLNSLRGEGFLNMRLTDAEAAEAVGIDPVRQVFAECVADRAVPDGARRRRLVLLLDARHVLPACAAEEVAVLAAGGGGPAAVRGRPRRT